MDRIYLVVTIDTEEEGLWRKVYPKDLSPVENIKAIPRFQKLCDKYSVTPTYLCTYSVSNTPWSPDILGPIQETGRCEIGAHLHPWHTPPLEEARFQSTLASYLPEDILDKKLDALAHSIEKAFGERPLSFRAGRWGFNEKVAQCLIDNGFKIDTSICPFLDFGEAEVPVIPYLLPDHYWLNPDNIFSPMTHIGKLLEIPATVGFNRANFEFCSTLRMLLQKRYLNKLRAIGILHYLGVLKLISLCPESNDYKNMSALFQKAKIQGIKVFNIFFHSSSLIVGETPYVKSNAELELFLYTMESLLELITTTTECMPMSLREMYNKERGM